MVEYTPSQRLEIMRQALSPLSQYEEKDTETGQILYLAHAEPGTPTSSPGWRIQKWTYNGAVTSILFANGDRSFSYVWDDRSSYSFS